MTITNITLKGISEVTRRFKKMRSQFPRKAARTLSRAQTEARQAFIDAISGPGGETTLNPGRAARLVRKGRRPSSARPIAYVNVYGDRIGVQHYEARETGRGVDVKIRKSGGAENYPRAFEWQGAYWQRQRYSSVSSRRRSKGDVTLAPSGLVGRLPILRLEGPRVTSLLANVESVREKTANRTLRVMGDGIVDALKV